MDFVLYPLDVQRCPVDFSSCEYVLNRTNQVDKIIARVYFLHIRVKKNEHNFSIREVYEIRVLRKMRHHIFLGNHPKFVTK